MAKNNLTITVQEHNRGLRELMRGYILEANAYHVDARNTIADSEERTRLEQKVEDLSDAADAIGRLMVPSMMVRFSKHDCRYVARPKPEGQKNYR